MDERHLYDETMLDIDPILEDFPMEMYHGSPVSEGTVDMLENEQHLSPVIESLEEISPRQSNSMMSPQYGACIDPDIFLNGVVKRESESDCSTSSYRNTPSPSDSSKSGDSYPSSGYASCCSAQMNNILFDSPPTSPENPVSPPQLVSIPSNSIIRVGAAQLPTIKSSCPRNLADLKKVKISPKGSSGLNNLSTEGTTNTITKKTIVLTTKDYQALMKNIRNKTNHGTILIKATHASAVETATSKDKLVLPKPLQQPEVTSVLSGDQKKEPVQYSSVPISHPAAQTPLLLPTIEGSVNERVFKKHQRMIKNRESAYMSRVRKKEYVTSLEHRIDELTKENHFLKNENTNLMEKLKQKCSCRGEIRPSFGHVNAFTKQLTPNVRKNTAIVLAMLFMVSFNFGPLGNFLIGSVRNQAALETNNDIPHHQRNLLWIEDSNVFNARNVDISLNLSNYEDLSSAAVEEPYAVCPFYVNQTENIRLASELRRWIGENGYKNLTDHDGDDMSINSFSEMFALKDTIDSMYRQMKDISSQMDAFQKRTRLTSNKKRPQYKGKKAREMEIYQQQKARKGSDLAFYYSGFSKKYAKFFEEIGRRDDTFYLVSFSGEHLLLPALAHNKTNRPKMSLMLPAMIDNATHPSDKVTLMQIDCEVMNTSMIQIREKTIPGDLLRAHAKADDGTRANEKKTKPSTDFSDNNVQNVSSTNTAKENKRHHKDKDPSARPFFVQRMSEHMKSEYDLH